MNDVVARPRRRERSIRTTGLRQLPFARIRNPYKPVEVLSADHLEAIHRASTRLLAEVGVEVMHEESRQIFRQAGAEVDEATQRVRCDPAMIEAEIAKAPASFTIETRDPAKSIVIGGDQLVFSSVGGPAFANDLDRGRRAGNSADMRDYIKLVQSLNVIHQEGGGPIEPTDLPAESRHLDFYEAALTLTDKSWECWALGGYRVRDALEMISIAYGIPRDRMDRQITAITVINSNSPLRLDNAMGEGLVELARSGQASILTPFTLAGAMSPVTLGRLHRAAECRGAVHGDARPARAARGRRGLWRLHLQCGHAQRGTCLRHAGICQIGHGERPARAALPLAFPLQQCDLVQLRRCAGGL